MLDNTHSSLAGLLRKDNVASQQCCLCMSFSLPNDRLSIESACLQASHRQEELTCPGVSAASYPFLSDFVCILVPPCCFLC